MSLALWLPGAVALGAGLIVGAGALAEARRSPLAPDRAPEPGWRLIDLPQGRTHLRWNGPRNGRVVVFVAGLSNPSAVSGPLAERVARAGYRVLRYDHFGRGLSDRTPRAQSAAFLTGHLHALLVAEAVEQPVILMGYSMGGAVATAFADTHPDHVRALALLAPGGLKTGLSPLYGLCAGLPVLGDAIWSLWAGGMLRAGAAAEAAQAPELPDLAQRIARETGRKGYLPAILSCIRHMLGRAQDVVHARLGARGLPVLAIWGERDDVIPISSRDRLARANPQAEHVTLPGIGHALAYTHPDAVAAPLIRWLDRLAAD